MKIPNERERSNLTNEEKIFKLRVKNESLLCRNY